MTKRTPKRFFLTQRKQSYIAYYEPLDHQRLSIRTEQILFYVPVKVRFYQ